MNLQYINLIPVLHLKKLIVWNIILQEFVLEYLIQQNNIQSLKENNILK